MSNFQEFEAALGVYVRETEDEVLDTRLQTLSSLAAAEVEVLIFMEPGDLAALLSCGVSAEPKRKKRPAHKAVDFVTPANSPIKLFVAINHPAEKVVEKLTQLPKGRKVLGKIHKCLEEAATSGDKTITTLLF